MARSNRANYSGAVYKVIDVTLHALTYCAAAALLLAYLSPHVNPNTNVWFSFLGLAAPVIYVVNVLLMLYWIIRWREIAIVLAAVLLLGMGNVGKYFKPSLSKSYSNPKEAGSIRVLSYNVCGFLGQQNGRAVNTMDEIAEYINEVNPDIICFQEFAVNRVHPRENFDAKLSDWKYKSTVFSLGNKNSGAGLAIYSKYPLTDIDDIQFENSSASSMWADVVIRRDTIRLYNNHLQSTEIDVQDKEFIESEMITNDSRKSKVMGIARKLKRNFEKRANQADSVGERIHDGKCRVVVCGDFNDTPMSYTYSVMRGNFVDTFKKRGRGMVSTYNGLYGILRIDYIFHSRDLETVSYGSSNPNYSDHDPVVVDVKFKHK